MSDAEQVTVDREVLAELVDTAKGKLEADVSRWGRDDTGYDVAEFAETIDQAEDGLESSEATRQNMDGCTRTSQQGDVGMLDNREIDAIADAIEEHDAVTDVSISPVDGEFTNSIVVSVGGEIPSTHLLEGVYREFDLTVGYAYIGPRDRLRFSITAKDRGGLDA